MDPVKYAVQKYSNIILSIINIIIRSIKIVVEREPTETLTVVFNDFGDLVYELN